MMSRQGKGICMVSQATTLLTRPVYTLNSRSLLRSHKRRMETEDKAKVVASAWGAKFIQFLAGLAVLPQSIWKKLLNSAGLFGRNG